MNVRYIYASDERRQVVQGSDGLAGRVTNLVELGGSDWVEILEQMLFVHVFVYRRLFEMVESDVSMHTHGSDRRWASGSAVRGSTRRSEGRRFDSRVHPLSD